MLTHAELLAEMMTNPAVKAEYEHLNASEEFFLLDLVSARRQSGLSIETQPRWIRPEWIELGWHFEP